MTMMMMMISLLVLFLLLFLFFLLFSFSETSSSEGCFDEIVEGKAHLITNPKPREEILEDKKRKSDRTTSYQHKNSKGVHVPSMCSR